MPIEKKLQVVSFGKNLHLLPSTTLELYKNTAEIIARLKNFPYSGELNGHKQQEVYLIPFSAITQQAEVNKISAKSVFGRIAKTEVENTSLPFYPLVEDAQTIPSGWKNEIAEKARGAVREGFTVFSAKDLETASDEMLNRGIRASSRKSTEDPNSITPLYSAKKYKTEYVHRLPQATFESGLYVTADYSKKASDVRIGQIELDNTQVSYFAEGPRGDNDHQQTDLTVVRGDFAELKRNLPHWIQSTVDKAIIVYEATQSLREVSPTIEYTVERVISLKDASRLEAHVIGQQLHITPNTASVLVALRAFQDNEDLSEGKAQLHERYGPLSDIPQDIFVHFQTEKGKFDTHPVTGGFIPFTIYTQLNSR